MLKPGSVCLTSKGPALEYWPGYLGIYVPSGLHKNATFYTQLDTIRGYNRHLYKDNGKWCVSYSLEGADGVLCCENVNDNVPGPGLWSVWFGGSYNDDPSMDIETNINALCSGVTISLSKSIFKILFQLSKAVPDITGDYDKTFEYSCGHVVFKHKTEELFLKIVDDYSWGVTRELTSRKPILFCPRSAGESCIETGTKEQSWKYWSEYGQQFKDIVGITFNISCKTHSA